VEPKIRITEVPIPEKEKPPAGTCVGCGSLKVNMSVFLIATTRNVSPRITENSHVLGVCSSCCDPQNPTYKSFCSTLGVQVFSLRNAVFQKLAEVHREKVGQ